MHTRRVIYSNNGQVFVIGTKIIFQYPTGIVYGVICQFDDKNIDVIGVRVQGHVHDGKVTLYTDHQMDFNVSYITEISEYNITHDLLIQHLPQTDENKGYTTVVIF